MDTSQPLAFGMHDAGGRLLRQLPGLPARPGRRGRRASAASPGSTAPEPLRSGWAWGQEHLEGGAAVVEAPVGKGTLYLFGPEILFRGQPHGTFKFFFNALSWAGR